MPGPQLYDVMGGQRPPAQTGMSPTPRAPAPMQPNATSAPAALAPQMAPAAGAPAPDFATWLQQNGGKYGGNVGAAYQDFATQGRQAAAAAAGDARRNDYNLPGYAQRDAQYGGYVQQGAADQADMRQRQGGLADYLTGLVHGQDSMAQKQIQMGTDRALAGQQALMASARPGQQGLAALAAANNAGRIAMDATGQGVLGGIAERQAAANSLSGVLGGARAGDLGMMGQNQQLQLQNAGMQQQGQMGYENNDLQRWLQNQQSGLNLAGVLGPVATIAGGLLGGPAGAAAAGGLTKLGGALGGG